MTSTPVRLSLLLLATLILFVGCSSHESTDADGSTKADSLFSTEVPDSEDDSGDGGEPVVSTMASLAGSYDGKFDFPEEFLEMMKGIAEASGTSIEDQMNTSELVLILNSDGTYEQAKTDDGRTRSEFGSWTLSDDGKEVTLSVPNSTSGSQPESAGDDPYHMLTMFVSDDGQRLRLIEEEGEYTMTLIYIKQ